MKNLNNTLNATANNTTAKITTAEALDIIVKNYEAIQDFEDEYNNFLVDDCKGLDEDVLEKIAICDEGEDLLDSLYGHSLYCGLELVYNKCTNGPILANVGFHNHYISEYVYDIEDLLEGEDDGELSVELRNDVAEWGDDLGDVLDSILEECKERLEDYNRTIDEYKETKRSLEHDLYRYNDAIEALSMIDSDAARDYELDFDNDYFEVEDGYYGAKEITERYDDMSSFYFDSDEGNDFCGWEIQREFEDAVEETVGDIIAQILSNIDESTLGEDEKRNLVDIKGVQCFCDELRFLDRWDNLLFKYDCLEQKVVD